MRPVTLHILGVGCQRCNTLAERTQQAAESLGIDYELIKVTDIEGKVIRELAGETSAGLHRVNWDLRQMRTRRSSDGSQRPSRSRGGGIVASGKYLITLVANDQEFKTVLTVEDAPRNSGPQQAAW